MRNNTDNKNKKIKKSTVLTPDFVAKNIYDNVKRYPFKNILDIGCFDGSLSKYFTKKHNSKIIGLDIDEEFKENFDLFIHKDFLKCTKKDFEHIKIDLILTNPPFGRNKEYGDLYPNLFIKKIFEIFGKTMPVIMISGHWFLSNSNNRMSFLNGANITKITTLHKNTFVNCEVSVESDIIYFNIKQKINNDFLEFEKPKKPQQKFKTIALNKKQIEFINNNIKNFSGEIKKLLKEKYEDFPIKEI